MIAGGLPGTAVNRASTSASAGRSDSEVWCQPCGATSPRAISPPDDPRLQAAAATFEELRRSQAAVETSQAAAATRISPRHFPPVDPSPRRR